MTPYRLLTHNQYYMKATSVVLVILCIFFASKKVVSQEVNSGKLILDLAGMDPGETRSISGNNSFEMILLKNVIPGMKYNIKISKTVIPMPALPAPNIPGPAATDSAKGPCEELNLAYLKLLGISDPANDDSTGKTEKAVSENVLVLQKEIDKGNCTKKDLVDSAQSLISKFQKEINEKVSIKSGEKVVITVWRDDKIWTWEFVGDETGEWVLSYGFGFCSAALAGKTYHLQQMDDTTTYKITQDAKPGALELAYIPAIFYSFLPSAKYNSSYNWSITAGLGFDLSAPVVFFGGGFMYRQNIGVNMGVAFQQQDKLYPQYSEGQILASPMQDAQLHKQVYRPNLFISVNFRFDKSKDNEIKEAMKPK